MSDTEKADSTRTNSLPWIVLSGIVGLYAVGTPAPSNSAKDAPAPTAAKSQADEPAIRVSTTNPLLRPIEEFHSTHDGRWTAEDFAEHIRGYPTEFIIATVPDPIDSPFGYSFDQTVDAIQRAVQQKDGYLLDRAWLPWDVDRKTKGAPGKEQTFLHQTTPGVLLFRHAKDDAKVVKQPSLCVVFLVGETPLGGIHKRAFWKCLNMISEAGLPVDEPIRVVGPYFTGSQTSLQFVIDDWIRSADTASWLGMVRPSRFRVVVGNASGMKLKETLRETWGPDKVDISSTVTSGRVQLNAILHFLAERDGAKASDAVSSQVVKNLPGRIAILSESNTGFGKQFAAYGEQNDVIVLRFPLHISRLKSEYAQAFHKKDVEAGLQSTATVSPAGFEDAGGVPEGVSPQGGAATMAANNAVLSTILSTISRERFRYVGVMATDTRDKLFLIRLIREYCPDVHVFVTQNDLLLTHPDYLYHMKGVLVGSTYPLYPPNQQWVRPDAPERLLLSSGAAQGYYNATLATLGLYSEMLEYGPPGFAAGPDVRNDRPPVWISMVAPNGTLVPLQLFTGYEDPTGSMLLRPNPGDFPPATGLPYPGSLYLTGVVIAAFWLVLLVKFWRGRGLWAAAAASGRSAHAGVFRTVLLGAQMVFAMAVVAVASARVEHTVYESPGDIALFGVAGVAWLLFLFTALRGVSFRRPAKTGPDSRRWRWDLLNLLIILGLVGFAVLFLGRFWMVCDRPHRALFFVRAVDLASGLSPLTPLFLMCMAVTAGAYFQLERRELARKSRMPAPFPPDAERVFDRLTDHDRKLKVEMTPGRFWKRYRLALVSLFAGLAVAEMTVWRDSLPTVEGNVWDALFAVGFAGIYAFAALTILQTVLLWRQTKQLLGSLAQLPLMRVFVRLPARITSLITRHLYTRSTQPLMLQMTVHQLRLLADTAKADASAPEPIRTLGPIADDAEARLQAFTNPEHSKPGDPAEETALRELLSKAASRSLEALSPRWKALPTDEAFGGSPAEAPTGTPTAPEAAWVPQAEELVATQTVNYLSQFFIQLRSLMLAVLVCSSLLLISATSYPFHPERLLLVFLLGLVGAGLACVVYVFLDMSMDETVGRISKSSGRFSLDSGFLSSFFTYIVPTVGLLAAQLSGTFRWALEPILRVVK
jgi:hypothetical protein